MPIEHAQISLRLHGDFCLLSVVTNVGRTWFIGMKIYFNLIKMFQFIYNTILQLEVAQIQVVQDV